MHFLVKLSFSKSAAQSVQQRPHVPQLSTLTSNWALHLPPPPGSDHLGLFSAKVLSGRFELDLLYL